MHARTAKGCLCVKGWGEHLAENASKTWVLLGAVGLKWLKLVCVKIVRIRLGPTWKSWRHTRATNIAWLVSMSNYEIVNPVELDNS